MIHCLTDREPVCSGGEDTKQNTAKLKQLTETLRIPEVYQNIKYLE